MEKYNLVLASQSPRRKELLSHLGLNFEIRPSDCEEISSYTDPAQLVMDLSFQKAKDVFDNKCNDIKKPFVIGSDTIVYFKGKVLGKPHNLEKAKQTLLELSGQTHQVYTGVSFLYDNKRVDFYDKSEVSFENISSYLLENYLESKDSLDKAGAYGIQAGALSFIQQLKGSYSNVVGFPLNLVAKKLEKITLSPDLSSYF